MQEGRLGMRQVEEARVAENAKWIAFTMPGTPSKKPAGTSSG
jgi:hypothetical protein